MAFDGMCLGMEPEQFFYSYILHKTCNYITLYYETSFVTFHHGCHDLNVRQLCWRCVMDVKLFGNHRLGRPGVTGTGSEKFPESHETNAWRRISCWFLQTFEVMESIDVGNTSFC